MKQLLRKLTPKSALLFYHFLKAKAASFKYRNPSRGMIVIGITGTKGKSSAGNFLWAGLTGAGIKTGLLSTANIRIGDRELPNRYHMTMPNPFMIQSNLRRMAEQDCRIAIVETTSEGILQSRHKGINYDMLVFTNLTPEHIRSHGTFENYKAAKQKLFKELSKHSHKIFDGFKVPKTIIVNNDSDHASDFYKFSADQKYSYSIKNDSDFKAENVNEDASGVSFAIGKTSVRLRIPGLFNVLNALPLFAVCRVLEIPPERAALGLGKLTAIPGRMETIINDPFRVIVDYAHEKESMNALISAARKMIKKSIPEAIHKTGEQGRVIVLLGAEGGGRDKTKRALMGEIAGRGADIAVISNVDPYEEPPMNIINEIANSAIKAGKTAGRDLFLIEDRREGIKKCLETARPGDLVLITGKGSEQSMIIGDKKIPWDDRKVVRDLLRDLKIAGN